MSDETYVHVQEQRHRDEVDSLRAKLAEVRLERDDLRMQLECALARVAELERSR